jgi:predicted secreted protein
MSLPISLGLYFICWWLAFFVMLPFGVQTHADHDMVEPGMADSAPVAPNLLWKAAAATLISAIVFAGAYAIIVYRLIPLDWVPGSL